MKYEITNDFPHDIIFEEGDVSISIYQPTTKVRSSSGENIILFKDNIKKVRNSLEKDYSKTEIDEIIKPLVDLSNDTAFFRDKIKESLTVFLNRDKMVVYTLTRDLENLVVVSDAFHIKPLVRVFQSADKYYLLGISRKTFKLFYGDRYGLQEIALDENAPIDIEKVMGDTSLERSVGRAGSGATFNLDGADTELAEVQNYFRIVDRYILNNFARKTHSPVLLVALEENASIFRDISKNNLLMPIGINKDFESLDINKLREESWDIVEEKYLNKTKVLVDRFEAERNKGLASGDLGQVGRYALENRVQTLLVDSDKLIPGKLDTHTKTIIESELNDPDTGDILSDMTRLVLQAGGEVVALPEERMPTESGVAAIYRY